MSASGSEDFGSKWRGILDEAARSGEFVDVPDELTVEDLYPGLSGVELDNAINATWLLDDDVHATFFDKETNAELLVRHPSINMDRGDEADLESLSKKMEKDGWVDGVGGVPFFIRTRNLL